MFADDMINSESIEQVEEQTVPYAMTFLFISNSKVGIGLSVFHILLRGFISTTTCLLVNFSWPFLLTYFAVNKTQLWETAHQICLIRKVLYIDIHDLSYSQIIFGQESHGLTEKFKKKTVVSGQSFWKTLFLCWSLDSFGEQ